jgi:SAM-dependent methyltransferase
MLERFRDSFMNGGVKGILYKTYVLGFDYWFDIRYGTDTNNRLNLENLTVPSKNRRRGRPYQATRAVPLKRLFRLIRPVLPPGSVLLDLGCGKGRVMMVASEFPFREIRGLEFARELCNIGRKNCEIYKKANRIDIELSIIESDAADYMIRPDENVFFFYNSFDEKILNKVLANIGRSLDRAPRKALFIFYNPHLSHVMEKRGRFAKLLDFRFYEYRFLVYSNAPFRRGRKRQAAFHLVDATKG